MADDMIKTGDQANGVPPALGDAGKRALEAERKARREAEQHLEQLGKRVEALQRGEAERIAAAASDGFRPLAAAGDLWKADGVDLAALLDDDGNVDAGKVRATVGTVLEQRPHWGVQPPRAYGSSDAGRGSAPSAPSMSQVAESILRGS